MIRRYENASLPCFYHRPALCSLGVARRGAQPAVLGGLPRLHRFFRLSASGAKGAAYRPRYRYQRRGMGAGYYPCWCAGDRAVGSYALTGVIAFVMCIQAQRRLLAFIPGTFIGACATFAGQGDWHSVLPALWLGVAFGAAMNLSGRWLARPRKAADVKPDA